MIYSIPYVALLLLFGFLAIYSFNNRNDEAKRRNIGIWCALIFLFFFGFRGFTCDDWINYYQAFQKCSFEYIKFNVFTYNIRWNYEPGFTLLMYLCKLVINDYHFFVFICTLINTLLIFNFLHKRIENIPLGFILFLSFGGYGMSTNLMRNSIAILIFVNALIYLEKRKPLQYFGLCILALSFHLSAVMYFPLYFFFHKQCSKWIYLTLFIIGNVVFLLHIPIFMKLVSLFLDDAGGALQMKVYTYTTSSELAEMKTVSIGYLERLFTGILIFCYYRKLVEIRKGNIIFINALLCYFLTFFLFSEFGTISDRMSLLFIFGYWIIWNDFFKCFFIENNRKLFLAFISIYFVLKMVGSTNMITSEYDNVLFGAKSYEERLYIHNRYSNE